MAEIGWISVHRKIRDCIIWTDNEPFDRRSAWIDLLLMANHEEKRIIFNGDPITVGMGQRITSMRKLAERWHWSRDRVKRYLDLLEGEQMITKKCDNTKTLLTIVNYEKYQGDCDTDKPQTSPPTRPQASHRQVHRQVTNNNENNENNENKKIYGEFGHVKMSEREMQKLINDYGEEITNKAIKAVDEYCQQKGKTYKDYYLTIKKWGIKAARNEKEESIHSNDLDEFIKRGGFS